MEPQVIINKRKGRSKKPVLADVTENNFLQTEVITIKKEKISDIQEVQEEPTLNVQIKQEMPAPTRLPPRKKKIKAEKVDLPKRTTRTRSKRTEVDEVVNDSGNSRSTKSSDVIIQNTTITTIEISDNEKETDTETDKIDNQDMRSTRSKMRKQNKTISSQESLNKESSDEGPKKNMRSTRTKTKQKKRNRSNSVEYSIQVESKRSKSNSNTDKEFNGTLQTEYEDAVSVIENNQEQPADATYIAASNNLLSVKGNTVPLCINSTISIENPKIVRKETLESSKSVQKQFEDVPKTPPKNTNKNGSKQIFSPFEKTPLKKKIEAFEKLGVESSAIPTRVTRTNKKVQKDDQRDESETKPIEQKRRNSPEKEKVLTPMTSKFIPKVCSTSKVNKLHPMYNRNTSTSNESILSVKSSSALKASQAEFREREKRRQEKEREALRKREALLQAQTEEKRRKREEKQQRAQQQREILEKETQKQLEAQRIKEEKYKQAMAEREKRFQKQKEEAEKKRQMAKIKANELLREKEEVIRIAEQKKYAEMKAVLDKQEEMSKFVLKQKMERAQQQSLPIYMTTKPPFLPTDDCYDSDDPDYDPNKKVEPVWAKSKQVN